MEDYRLSPDEFHATSYWAAYEQKLLEEVSNLDLSRLRSGKAQVLETFGFNDITYKYQSKKFFLERWLLQALTKTFGNLREILPYGIKLKDIREMAIHHCQIVGELAHARPIGELSVSEFGKPADLFEHASQKYTMPFLNNYVRYCFAKKHIPLTGREVFVELGTGSGYQIEVLKKIHPDMTVLCFDLPAQIFLCEEYLRNVFGDEAVIGADETSGWSSMADVQYGKIHFFGNWKWPLLKGYEFDLFWNAASFGEMEPEVVRNYLSYINDSVDYVCLLQARHGKETSGKGSAVKKATTFSHYQEMLDGFRLLAEQDAWHAHKRLSGSGGYFQACWRTERKTSRGRSTCPDPTGLALGRRRTISASSPPRPVSRLRQPLLLDCAPPDGRMPAETGRACGRRLLKNCAEGLDVDRACHQHEAVTSTSGRLPRKFCGRNSCSKISVLSDP